MIIFFHLPYMKDTKIKAIYMPITFILGILSGGDLFPPTIGAYQEARTQ